MSALLLLAALLAVPPDAPDWQRLENVRRSYDYAELDRFIADISTKDAAATAELLAEALLAKAEWLRIDLEVLPEDDRAKRQELGNAIDDLAKQGLELCAAAPETSEWLRRAADLRGTLIRSKYRAKKHRKTMEAEAEAALRLDPQNARAYVTRAKPYLFADDRHGGDVEQAVRLLQHALDLDPDLEAAHLLTAYAFQEEELTEQAKERYQQILSRNPACKPAKTAFERLDASDTIPRLPTVDVLCDPCVPSAEAR